MSVCDPPIIFLKFDRSVVGNNSDKAEHGQDCAEADGDF
jgi:hypothetical protein